MATNRIIRTSAIWFLLSMCVAFATRGEVPININIFGLTNGTIQIAWPTVVGKVYAIRSTTDLAGLWATNLPTLTAKSNSIVTNMPAQSTAIFYKVVKIDTEGPEVYQTSPIENGIGAPTNAVVQAWIRDETGIDTNSIEVIVGTNSPMTLADSRLSFDGTTLTYNQSATDILGEPGNYVAMTLLISDTLGNQTSFNWSFRLALSTTIVSNTVFLGTVSNTSSVITTKAPQTNATLTLMSTNGDYFTYSYTGTSSGFTTNMQLIDPDPQIGYTRTVISFTESNNTVTALTRPTKVAELLESGTLSSANFTDLTSTGTITPKTPVQFGLDLGYSFPLSVILYDDGNLLLETTEGSQLNIDAALNLSANFEHRKLTAFEANIDGTVDFELDAHARALLAQDFSGSKNLIKPIHKFYFGTIGPVPVWLEVVFEVDVGFTAHSEAQADCTTSINASKHVLFGRRWDSINDWSQFSQNPASTFTFTGPVWQAEGSVDLKVYLQPKITLLVESLAGVTADLQPYDRFAGSVEASPYSWDLALSAGVDSTIGLDLRVWDDAWGQQPSTTFNIIPETPLWQSHGPDNEKPGIIVDEIDQNAPIGSRVTLAPRFSGSDHLNYRWMRNGLWLTDDSHLSGTQSSVLQIAPVQSIDSGTYTVSVENAYGKVLSHGAVVTVLAPSPGGMAFVPSGPFDMGNCMDASEGSSNELPLHTVNASDFYIDQFDVTESLWTKVYSWAVTHGYSFDNPGVGKGPNHPIQSINWFDCAKWCNARSEQEGRTPAYYTSGTQTVVYRTGQTNIDNTCVKWNTGYRLPTEAEWEKAARGGSPGHRFPCGDIISESLANYIGDTNVQFDLGPTGYNADYANGNLPYTSPVGSFPSNGYDLFDMAGNVFQWCWDWYGSYTSAQQGDPHGPASGSYRLLRGNSWRFGANGARCSARSDSHDPATLADDVGFRCVLPLSVAAAPIITTQPRGHSVAAGDNVTLTVTVVTALPATFQWQHNGVNIPGATGPTLQVNNIQSADLGYYRVIISNAAGTVTSANAAIYSSTIGEG